MKRIIAMFAFLAISMSHTVQAADTVLYKKSKIVDVKQKETKADLIFNRETDSVVVEVADKVIYEIPYKAIDKVAYDFSKKRRVKEGALVRIASLGAGAVVMLTKSKKHWLYIDYKEEDVPKEFVLRLDKKEYNNVLLTAQEEIGKEIENFSMAKIKDKDIKKYKKQQSKKDR